MSLRNRLSELRIFDAQGFIERWLAEQFGYSYEDFRYGRIWTAPPTALVLSGGGAKGSFQVGALAYLRNLSIWYYLNLRFLCGTSVGAINSLAIAESGDRGIDKLVRLYLSLRHSGDMFAQEGWLTQFESIASREFDINVESLLSAGSFGTGLASEIEIVNCKTVILTVLTGGIYALFALQDVEDEVNRKMEALNTLASLYQSAKSLYNLLPIEGKIRENIDFNGFGPSMSENIKMRLATVCLEDGEVYYVTESGRLFKGHAANPESIWNLPNSTGMGSIKEAIIQGTMASAAMPGMFRRIQLREDPWTVGHFVDGGVREILPIRAAAELGAQRIIAISASPLNPEQEAVGSYYDAHMTKIATRSIDTMTSEVRKNERMPDAGWSDDIERIFIFPEIHVHGTTTVNPGLILINMAYGYMRAHEQTPFSFIGKDLGAVEAIFMYLSTLAITELRMRIWEIEQGYSAYRRFLLSVYDAVKGEKVYYFNRYAVEKVRDLKRQVLDWVELRMTCVDYDRKSLPVVFRGPDGVNRTIFEWWESWEQHGGDLDILGNYDPWTALPIDIQGTTYEGYTLVYEDTVPQKPVPSNELLAALS